MPKAHQPRSGSMQFWPRKRAKREHARVRSWAEEKEAKPLAFAGYKVGMTHILATDNRKKSMTKDEEISYPVTIIECPPLRLSSVRFYVEDPTPRVSKEIFVGDHKDLKRKLNSTKKSPSFNLNPDEFSDITITVHTLPSSTGIGKKTPELFEIHLGGNNADKLAFAKDNVGKDIPISSVFAEGDFIDTHGITTGRGNQGPVKRFGIGLKSHKSEKGRRRPGSLGGWKGQQHFMYRVPMSGQTGYHQRTQYNIQIFKIGNKPEEVNVSGGFINYGEVKNDYILVKGSVQGPQKRMIILTKALRPTSKPETPTITYVSQSSKQGR